MKGENIEGRGLEAAVFDILREQERACGQDGRDVEGEWLERRSEIDGDPDHAMARTCDFIV